MYPGCFIRGLMSNPGQVNRLNSEMTMALPGASPAVRAISSGITMAFLRPSPLVVIAATR